MVPVARTERWGVLLIGLVCSIAGCTSSGPSAPTPGTRGVDRPPTEARKTLTVAALNSVKGFSPWLIGTTGGGARSLFEIHSNGLVTTDVQGDFQGQLAARLPSLGDGSVVVLPDGRMQTTWSLRPNVKWHDGAPFTADDLVFSWRVQAHPEIPTGGSAVLGQIESVQAADPLTATVTWKTTFFKWRELNFIALWPFPKHLLGEAFEGDKEAFLSLPYWTTEYVQLGAFRLVDFGLGENLVLDRFDDYFLGRPKVDRIIIKIIPNESTVFANVLAGTIDIVTESVLGADLGSQLREEWKSSGGGSVVERPSVWRFVNIEHNPDYGRPPELRQEVRVRRGLLVAIDRPALRDVDLPGFDTEMDSFILPSDPRASLVGKPFARFRYDPALASRELAEAGWTRGPDGRVVNRAGEPVQLNLRGTAGTDRQIAVIGQYWRALGLDVVEEIIPGSLMADRPFRATFPGMEFTAQGSGDAMLVRFDGRLCPRPPRFSGNQGGCYMNPKLDRLIDQLYGSLELRDQGLVLKDIGDLFAAELPALPMYYNVTMAAVRKSVYALMDDFAGAIGPGNASRRAHLWDRD